MGRNAEKKFPRRELRVQSNSDGFPPLRLVCGAVDIRTDAECRRRTQIFALTIRLFHAAFPPVLSNRSFLTRRSESLVALSIMRPSTACTTCR